MTASCISSDETFMRAAAERIAERVVRENDHEVSYRLDLALQGLLDLARVTGDSRWPAHVESVARRRGWQSKVPVLWRTEPFASLSWAWADFRGDPETLATFVEQTRLEQRTIWRSEDNLILHPRGEIRGGGYAVLIDSAAEYFSRTARAAKISGEAGFAAECAEQMERHRNVLRYRDSGLWSQGRGWLRDRSQLSPGAWSRGQGWLMRGMASALAALPTDFAGSGAHSKVREIFRELADALLLLQDESGLWHALPHRPQAQSSVETSGSGLISGALFRGVMGGHLPKEPYLSAARRAARELCRHVDEEGVVHNACVGPGPLEEERPWLGTTFPPGDHHGPGTVLGCFAAALAAEQALRKSEK